MTPDDALYDELHSTYRSLKSFPPKDATPDQVEMRFHHYEPKHGRAYTCPKCWMIEGEAFALRSTPGTNEYDVLMCGGCGGEVIIPFE